MVSLSGRGDPDDFYGAPTSALRQQRLLAEQAAPQGLHVQNQPLFYKQAIIVLREELEYFAIPPLAPIGTEQNPGSQDEPATDEHGNANHALMNLKSECGKHLLDRKSIFTALQRNVNRENNVAEQHLIDMLCMRLVYAYRCLRNEADRDSSAGSIEITNGDTGRWSRIGVVSPALLLYRSRPASRNLRCPRTPIQHTISTRQTVISLPKSMLTLRNWRQRRSSCYSGESLR